MMDLRQMVLQRFGQGQNALMGGQQPMQAPMMGQQQGPMVRPQMPTQQRPQQPMMRPVEQMGQRNMLRGW